MIQFLEAQNEWILGKLTKNHQFELKEQQRNVWTKEIEILKEELKDLTSARIIFEYSIPRMGKRADIILILNGLIFVIEFKLNENQYKSSDINQCFDYALDLKYFHESSYNIKIIPILVATNAVDFNNTFEPPYDDGVFKPLKCNRNNLNETIQRLSYEFERNYLDPIKWENSVYKPTPTIIEAAQALYQGHSVREISRSDSGAENLTKTADAINKIIEKSKRNKTKSICFITGVPGAGKTLAGLNLANERHKFSEEEHAVFLSGNGPLVEVLQEALARNKVENSLNGIKKTIALRESKAFIQNIHHFRDDALENNTAPIEKVVVFDEAQRAWNQKQTSFFMQRKKGIDNFIQSEPEFLINVMDRREDWCVIVCLIGGGQEINTGEAGLIEWFSAIKKQFNHWQVYVSNEISDTEYTRELDLKNLFDGIKRYEFCYNNGIAFYTIAGKQFGKNKSMTLNHTGITNTNIINYNTDKRSLLKSIKQHPIYNLIKYIPFGKRSIHDLHLTFEAKGLWKYLVSIDYFKKRLNSKKAISFGYFQIEKHLAINVKIQNTDTVNVTIKCSTNPIILDPDGIMRLTEALTRVEERLAAILNDPLNKTHNIEYNPSEIKIPNKDDWKIVLWHFNRDSLTEYSGEKFHCSWKVAKNLFIRVYSKGLKLRMEIQENPDIVLKQLITRFIKDNNKTTRLIELLN